MKLLILLFLFGKIFTLDNGLAKKPPMGWINSNLNDC